jgi:transaldolase/glucose-6-phosphate isomerase
VTSFAPPVARLPGPLSEKVSHGLAEWNAAGGTRRLWARDASLWTNGDEAKWLGWLDVVDEQLASFEHLRRVADFARGFEHAVVLGMGGSSLCPDVLARTFGGTVKGPRLHVLDSTDPAQIRRLESSIDVAKTLFFVSSKSGGTLEPNLFLELFLDRVRAAVGPAEAGCRFIAVTDPGSRVETIARENGFHVCAGVPSIGGRYSALSDFGMAPAAAMGLDVEAILVGARGMVAACREEPAHRNPGVALGVTLGVLAREGRDKLTVVSTPSIASFGAWLEQLVAESTGKRGKAVIPVDGETLGPPEVYGDDRVFVHVRRQFGDPTNDAAVERLAEAGHPVLRIDVEAPLDLGAEFFRWEVATAVVGSLLGIDPFDQPDVEASKVATRKLVGAFDQSGALPAETAFRTGGPFAFFADPRNEEALAGAPTPEAVLGAHLARLRAGDYFGLLLYLDMSDAHVAAAQAIRHAVRDGKRVATCVGFGPRFLHSTGQAYKGGPDSGVFLQVTCDDADDVAIPGRKATFGVVKAAQARGDFDVLAERGRRALRVHLRGDVATGLGELRRLIDKAAHS